MTVDISDLIALPREIDPLEDSEEDKEVDSVEDKEAEVLELATTETRATPLSTSARTTRMPRREPSDRSPERRLVFEKFTERIL